MCGLLGSSPIHFFLGTSLLMTKVMNLLLLRYWEVSWDLLVRTSRNQAKLQGNSLGNYWRKTIKRDTTFLRQLITNGSKTHCDDPILKDTQQLLTNNNIQNLYKYIRLDRMPPVFSMSLWNSSWFCLFCKKLKLTYLHFFNFSRIWKIIKYKLKKTSAELILNFIIN